jgi:hypothetical protein
MGVNKTKLASSLVQHVVGKEKEWSGVVAHRCPVVLATQEAEVGGLWSWEARQS